MWAPINYITPVQLESITASKPSLPARDQDAFTPVCVHAEVSRVLRHSGCPSAMERIAFSVTTMASTESEELFSLDPSSAS